MDGHTRSTKEDAAEGLPFSLAQDPGPAGVPEEAPVEGSSLVVYDTEGGRRCHRTPSDAQIGRSSLERVPVCTLDSDGKESRRSCNGHVMSSFSGPTVPVYPDWSFGSGKTSVLDSPSRVVCVCDGKWATSCPCSSILLA